MSSDATFEYFDHTADIGMRVIGDSFETLLSNAIYGLTYLLVGQSSVASVRERTLRIVNADLSMAFFDALNEVLFIFETEGFLVSVAVVQKTGVESWNLELCGEMFDPDRHARSHEVKAVTYHGLKVIQSNGHWQAEAIFDI